MTKKEFFTKKIIPRIEERIFEYDFQLIRNQYILERLVEELEELKRTPVFRAGDNIEKILKEREERRRELEQQIEEVKRNIAYLPLMKEEEEKFLEYFKNLIEKF
jgi:aminoglycoside phosphotransferase (APT) family kinase protein